MLIGDTRSDIEAARDGGARIITVVTGKTTVTQLQQVGASVVLPDLTDTAALVKA